MTNLTELQTIRDFLRYATSRFTESGLYYGHGTDNAWDEAFALVFCTLHLPFDTYQTVLDATLIAKERQILLELIEKRVLERIPVPYLTNVAWFGGLPFYIDERVLIPRSPIAELIENHFQPWVDPDSVENILDLCTGSGCIAIACAKAFPAAHVDATDISSDALAVAKINVHRHQLDDQVTLYQADLFNGLASKKYDIIVSNPPYVSVEEMKTLPNEYRHEPELGLVSGVAGLDCALTILKNAAKYLKPTGVLIVEVGNSEEALAELLPQVPFTWIEFERGGGGVFALTAEQLTEYAF